MGGGSVFLPFDYHGLSWNYHVLSCTIRKPFPGFEAAATDGADPSRPHAPHLSGSQAFTTHPRLVEV